ncbi:polyprenyl synthetase family protein [bacterium]|nr:polyprenyl synthetase family protein [bacterium]
MLRSGLPLVDTVAAHLVKSRGKGLRPALTLMSARASGVEGPLPERTLIAAMVVEMLHTASLVHDDVVDKADERRGRPTLNLVYNNKVAVLFGDFMLARALDGMFQQRSFKVLDLFSDCAVRLAKGELVEAIQARKLTMDKTDYFQMVADKTASLISAACQMGPLSLEYGDEYVEPLAKYGELVGIAFQIRDDLLDLGDGSKRIGKPIGLDLGQAKLTLPLIHTLEQLSDGQRKQVTNRLRKAKKRDKRGKSTDLREIVELIRDQGGIEYARDVALDYAVKAGEALDTLPDTKYREGLKRFAMFAAVRDR